MSASLEAKQTAGEWVAPVEITSFREAFAYGYDAATAKLRGELKKSFEDKNDEIQRLEQQLAHQQPSAPTPDVEKIADDTLRAYPNAIGDGAFKQQLLSLIIDGIVRYDAQARAPLVAVLEDVRKFIAADKSPTFHGKVAYLAAIDAALTGTREK